MEDGILLGVSGGALTAIGGIIGAWIQARRKSPQPFEIKQVGDLVTREDCRLCREAQERRDTEIFKRLNDDKNWQSGVSSQLGRLTEAVETIKNMQMGKYKQ